MLEGLYELICRSWEELEREIFTEEKIIKINLRFNFTIVD